MDKKSPNILIDEKGRCLLWEDIFENSQDLADKLQDLIHWRSDDITLFGKTHPIPRLHAWYGDPGAHYRYSGIPLPRHDWIPELKEIKDKIEKITGKSFNSVLCNLYRDGRDSNGWHSDDEKELISPVHIASVSLGQTRDMQFKKRGDKKLRHNIELPSGSLLFMEAPFQKFWLHQIPKRKTGQRARLNLTFRSVRINLSEEK